MGAVAVADFLRVEEGHHPLRVVSVAVEAVPGVIQVYRIAEVREPMGWVVVEAVLQIIHFFIAEAVVSSSFVVTVLHNLVNNILSYVQYMLN